MAQLSARRAALAALQTWRTKTRFADAIISELLNQTNLTNSDRGFALELFYGVLRNLTLLDFWIDCMRPAHVDVDIRDILRLGLYQLYCLDTPDHAAVYETVELATRRGRPVINGILRAGVRRKDELRARKNTQPLFVRTSHPQFLVARWQQRYGSKDTEALCVRNNESPRVYGRINRLRINRDDFLREYPDSQPLTDHPDFVEFHTFPSSALDRGHCYIQDPSTAAACRVLDPQPGERVLDVCAAPGGKTSYIAELMDNRGIIVACDRDPGRVRVLSENVARLGLETVQVELCDWESNCLPEKISELGPFDRILIDAPCSNTGVMQRRVDVRWRLQPADFIRMQKRQLRILYAVFPLLKPGGALVYSTCSLEPEENEEVVKRALAESTNLQLIEEKRSLPFRDGFDGAFAAKLITDK